MTPPTHITAAWLRDHRFCEPKVTEFDEAFPDGVPFSVEGVEAVMERMGRHTVYLFLEGCCARWSEPETERGPLISRFNGSTDFEWDGRQGDWEHNYRTAEGAIALAIALMAEWNEPWLVEREEVPHA